MYSAGVIGAEIISYALDELGSAWNVLESWNHTRSTEPKPKYLGYNRRLYLYFSYLYLRVALKRAKAEFVLASCLFIFP